VLTSLVLMEMAETGEVSVTDPVSKYLPVNVNVPERNGRSITLQDLATHRSGLPSEPPGRRGPLDGYTVGQLYDFLSHYQLARDIGSQFEYSNLGVGLLGYALSLRAGMGYEELLKARVLAPLGMKDTGITLSPGMKARLAVGHDLEGRPVPNLDSSTRVRLAPAGALLSTANDLLAFLAANLGYTKTPLAPAMAAQLSIRRSTAPSLPGMEIAYAWVFQSKNGNSIIWHNGSSPGYRTYLGFDLKRKTGVVVLANRFSPTLPDDIGRHLLDQSYPLP
jgi:CubicO group peptidase (beta-lactamase class C family)